MFDSTVVETTRPIEYGLLINGKTLTGQHYFVSDATFDFLLQQCREKAGGNVDLMEQGFRLLVADIINSTNSGQVPDYRVITMAISVGAVLHGTPAPEDRTYLLRICTDGRHDILRMDESIKEGLDTSEGAWNLWHRTQEMVDLAVAEAKGSA